MERLQRLGVVFALLLFGFVVVCLYGAISGQLQANPNAAPIAYIVAILVAGGMVALLLRVALVPDRRYTAWVKRLVTNINSRYLFGLLLVVWGMAMSLLAVQNFTSTQVGGLALIGLFAGFFIFMGFYLVGHRGVARMNQRGQGVAEYALILALIVVVAIVALVFLGTNISGILSTIAARI